MNILARTEMNPTVDMGQMVYDFIERLRNPEARAASSHTLGRNWKTVMVSLLLDIALSDLELNLKEFKPYFRYSLKQQLIKILWNHRFKNCYKIEIQWILF